MANQEKLNQLISRNDFLKPTLMREFETVQELRAYKSTHRILYDEYYANVQEIQRLEWELKTPEEQAEELAFKKAFWEKRNGGLTI